MKMTIEIDALRLYAFHGVMEQERRVGNFFEVSVGVTYPLNDFGAVSDEIDHTVNYAALADIIKKEMEVPSNLLEHVAARIRTAIISHYPTVTSGYVKVAKSTPPIGSQLRCASATLEW